MMALAGTDFNQGRGTGDDGTMGQIKSPESPIRNQNPPAGLEFYFEYIKIEYAACFHAESDCGDHLMKS